MPVRVISHIQFVMKRMSKDGHYAMSLINYLTTP